MFKTIQKFGFTMIELLIVIAVLGILAVAVLAAINPIEQINRGRDTGSRSDAEQLISAIDRFYASKGFYPWVESASVTNETLPWTEIDAIDAIKDGVALDAENVLDKLAGGVGGTGELKQSFVDRIVATQYNFLRIYNSGEPGSSTYVCFVGKSQAFQKEAQERCEGKTGAIPSDIDATTQALICGTCDGTTCAGATIDGVAGKFMTCLP